MSVLPWSSDAPETCYLLEGEVVVMPEHGNKVVISKVDLVIILQGMPCAWDIRTGCMQALLL
jgi:uncharacterized protein